MSLTSQVSEILDKELPAQGVGTEREKIRMGLHRKIQTLLLQTLYDYSIFLEKLGYTDVDWRAEKPTAIDEFTKTMK